MWFMQMFRLVFWRKKQLFLFYEEVIVEDIICFSFSVYLKAIRAEVKDPIEACGVPHLYTAGQE